MPPAHCFTGSRPERGEQRDADMETRHAGAADPGFLLRGARLELEALAGQSPRNLMRVAGPADFAALHSRGGLG
jgi:hypothetical protein